MIDERNEAELSIQYQKAALSNAEIAYVDLPADDSSKTILLIHGFASNALVNWIGTGWANLGGRRGRGPRGGRCLWRDGSLDGAG